MSDDSRAGIEAELAELRARVQALEDDRAIRSLLDRYGHTADTGDLEGFVDLYTSDAVIDLPAFSAEGADFSGATTSDGRVVWRGKDGVRSYTTMVPDHLRMHLQDNVVTHIDGDEAVAHAYQVSLTKKDGVTSIVGASNNQWRFRRIGGKWLMQERRAAYLGDDYYFHNLDAFEDTD